LGIRTPENIAQFLEAVGILGDIELACQVIGIHPSTLYRWQNEDPELARHIKAARARKIAGWVQSVDRATDKDWKAGTWLLERQPETRERYASQQRNNTIEVRLNITRD
jgi:hypothetical protein